MDNVFPLEFYQSQAKKNGRSDSFIAKTTNYAQNLQLKNLPVLFSLNHLGLVIGLAPRVLYHISEKTNEYYDFFTIRKKRGGYRQIIAPNPTLKPVQRWIHEHILSKVPVHSNCCGFVKNKSIRDNALIHSGSNVVLTIDLYRFYDTITEKRVYGVFKALGYHKNLAVYMAKLTTATHPEKYILTMKDDKNCPHDFPVSEKTRILPQGAPTSPYLSNIITKRLDARLSGLSRKLGINYSRYADDMTFSGEKDKLPSVNLINLIIREEGFYLNNEKTRFQKTGQKQLVTGLTVTNGVHVQKSFKKETRKHLYYCMKFGPYNHLEHINQTDKLCFKEWLLGRINFIHSIEIEEGRRLFKLFNEIAWPL